MEKRIVFNDGLGGVFIADPDPIWIAKKGNTLEKYAIEARKAILGHAMETGREIIGGLPHRFAEVNEVPNDKTFREAWTDDNEGDAVDIDMTRASDIHMNRIKEARDIQLKELDGRQYGSEKDAERQTLRDIPQTFDLSGATTPEELKALWPEGLG